MRLSFVPHLPHRVAVCCLSALTVLCPSTARGAGATRLRPAAAPQSAAKDHADAAQSVDARPEPLDTARTGALLGLYKQLLAGAPFSEEETIILNRFAGDRGVTELEADVVLSRALYASYVAMVDLTKEQEELLDRYSAFVARRTHDVADRKAELAGREAAKTDGEGRGPQVAPPNDTCAGAEVIPGAGPFPTLSSVVDITDATTTGDPVVAPSCAFAGGPVSRSVWYTFTPAATATYTLSVCADAPTATTVDDTVMAIYTSTSGCAGPFTQLPAGCDEDSCSVEGLQSVITIGLTASTQYYVVVWKYGTAAPLPGDSAVQLRVTQNAAAANDTCAGAIALTLGVPVTGSINSLTANDYQVAAAPNCFTGSGNAATAAPGRDVVYTFTPATSGSFSFRVTNYGQTSLVLYATADPCPTGTAPITVTTTLPVGPPAPCANRQVGTAEEVFCQALTGGTTYFVFVDETVATSGGSFTIEVTSCSLETEANNTTATANPAVCNLEGAITPNGDIDFYALGSFAAGSRLFAMIDGVATNNTDLDLRATTTTDTLEFDDSDNDAAFGILSPNVAGTKLPDATAVFLRVAHSAANVQTSPYRVYYAVQPGGSGVDGTSATPETEPNNTIATASAAANYYYSGALSSSSDVDLYRFQVSAGDLVFVSGDFDPTLTAGTPASSSPINGALAVLDASGVQRVSVNDGTATSNTTSGAASLTAATPNKPAEAIAFRAPASGVYYVRVTGTSGGDYLLSLSVNCQLGTMCTIACPSDITVPNDANQCGAVVSYPAPTTTSDCGAVTCAPQSGSFFPVGTTAVTCAAQFGPTCSFNVTVNDTQPPAIACPANVVRGNDANQCGAVVSYTTTATDNCPGVTVLCSPAPGSFFPKGTTTVSCTATDAHTNTASCSFAVTINDTQAPAISCPANITTVANTTQGTTPGSNVAFASPTVSDNCPGLGAPACSPVSGSFFPVGTTTVTCSVTDASSNTSSCSFTVRVGSAFTACCVDDATGNTLSIVADPASPIYGLWQLRIASSGQILQGTAEVVTYIPGRSLIASDHDNPTYRMDLNINYGTRTCTATVKVLATNVTYTIRDRNIANNPPC